ncbi:cytochrome P450 [Micromonospora sp. 15K316]|uniref:cytochrome P450 n=1 Tax=Micromonospora sp. 15K316 TaxID=2530376 RepID=UPI0010453EE8|nr:cytochrome P450 [Micromonospora sp. 15K316]TDC40398.1 cytochrome P450 [Micromonospora sp. 15K316]
MSTPAAAPDESRSFPIGRQCPYRPSTGYDAFRAEGPLSRVRLYDGREVWMVTGYAEARALLADRRVSINPRLDGFPALSAEMAELESTGYTDVLIGVDPPLHTRQRAMLIPSFSVRRMNALRPAIQDIIDQRVDAMLAAGPPAELVADFALPVPSMAVCVLLGVPYEDRAAFEGPARGLFDPDPDRASEAMTSLTEYFGQLVRAKERSPGTGLLDDLIAEQVRKGTLSRDELVLYAMLMLIAGQDTTANVISLGTLALLEHPDQFAKLCADPDLATGAVEEIMRYVSLIEAISRVALEDIDISGYHIKAGEGVLIGAAAANFSPALVPTPDELDVTRSPRHHLGFGFGVHQCIGQNLARIELELAFRTLPQRMPNLRLAVPADEIRTSVTGPMERLTTLPVTW